MPDETQEREPDGVRWAREVVDDDAPVFATQVSDMRDILAHIDLLTRERDELEQAVEALEAKCRALSPSGGTCACSWDGPGDLCMCHSPKLKAATDRLARFEALADGAREVMRLLTVYGSSVVPHLLDSDDNAGQRLRVQLAALAGPEGPVVPPPIHDDDTGHQEMGAHD